MKQGDLATNVHQLKGDLDQNKATFFSHSEVCCLPAPSSIKPEQRKFVLDSRGSVHMLSRKDLNSAALETVRVFRTTAKVISANWRSANERGSNSVRQRSGLVRDSTAPRRYSAGCIASTTMRGSWVFLLSGLVVRNHIFQKWQNIFDFHRTSCTAQQSTTSSSQDSKREESTQRRKKKIKTGPKIGSRRLGADS